MNGAIDNYQFEKFDLFELSQIKFELFSGSSRSSEGQEIGIVKFYGTYRIGSQGNPDAVFMRAVIHMFAEVCEPEAIILDLSELDYQWGDKMILILGHLIEFQDRPIIQATVIGDKSREGIDSLVEFEIRLGTDYFVETRKSIFDNLKDAHDYVEENLKTLT